MTSNADVRIIMSGITMTALHTKPVMMRPQVIHARVLLVYHLLGCTASQRQVGNPQIQQLLSNNSIHCENVFCSLH